MNLYCDTTECGPKTTSQVRAFFFLAAEYAASEIRYYESCGQYNDKRERENSEYRAREKHCEVSCRNRLGECVCDSNSSMCESSI